MTDYRGRVAAFQEGWQHGVQAMMHTCVLTSPGRHQAVPGEMALDRAPAQRLHKGQTLKITDDVQRVVGGLTTLSKAGDIRQEQADAADRWYRDYVMGVVGARDPDRRSSGKAPDLHAAMLSRTDAVGRCRTVREAVGLCGEVRLKLLLIDELSFSAIATQLLPGDVNGRKKVAAQMVFLLEQLAEVYGRIDRRRRTIMKN